LRADAAAQATVGAGDDVLAADDVGERDDAVGHEKGAGFQSHTEVQDLKKNNVAV
jgi:hypothetical protein